jgi:methenyltetrahydromethanopterin cyclohydrolase
MPPEVARPSLYRLTQPLLRRLVEDAAALRLGVETTAEGCTLIDAGIDHAGGIAAGLRIAEICLGGLGSVQLAGNGPFPRWPWSLSVHASHPVLACLGSQLAGWQLTVGRGKDTYNALGSGPGRAVARKEALFDELGYRDGADGACLVLEVEKRPPPALIEKVAKDCGLSPLQLTLILTPTKSLAGTVQIVARVLEVALHKLHELRFPLDRVVDGMGTAPLPPPAASFVAAMGAPTTPSSMAARCSSSSPVRTATPEKLAKDRQVPVRATTAGRSRRSSIPTTATSTPWTGCCSARPASR